MDNVGEVVKPKKHGFWQRWWWVPVSLVVVLGWIIDWGVVRDVWKGLSYQPDETMQEIEEALELTGVGRRIFAATHPVVEGASGFNEHCGRHDDDVSVLGCYADGKIYIYRITDTQLMMANRVTAAHELLHATWERMDEGEREKITKLLGEVQAENAAWFAEELVTYDEEDYLEEIYVRAGTKLTDLPEELEQYYAKYFQNRQRIVEMYKEYEAPFERLRNEIGELYEEIERVRVEIENEREIYSAEVDALDRKIEQFNACADTAGCFSTDNFNTERAKLVSERDSLEVRREELNQKIDENNARIDEYMIRQEALGGLYGLLDSNTPRVENEINL